MWSCYPTRNIKWKTSGVNFKGLANDQSCTQCPGEVKHPFCKFKSSVAIHMEPGWGVGYRCGLSPLLAALPLLPKHNGPFLLTVGAPTVTLLLVCWGSPKETRKHEKEQVHDVHRKLRSPTRSSLQAPCVFSNSMKCLWLRLSDRNYVTHVRYSPVFKALNT